MTFSDHAAGRKTIMNWYAYIACFCGMFLSNFVPHFVHGVSGDCFPTPSLALAERDCHRQP
jgi:hypothetical protein